MREGGKCLSKKYADEQLEQAYDLYAKSIERFCLSRLGEAYGNANDCVQEAFYIYYKRLLDNEHFENPRAFLYRTVSNLALKARNEYLKCASKTKSIDDESFGEIAVSIEESITDYTDYDRLKDLLVSRLNEGEQRLYQMKFVEDKNLAEISKILNINEKAVANRTHRLRLKIKRLIEPILKENEIGGG